MNNNDFTTACRICLEDGATYPLFESIKNESIHAKLPICLKEKIADIAGYPRNICIKCNNTLETLCNFFNKFEMTCEILQKKLIVVKSEYLDTNNIDDDEKNYNQIFYEFDINSTKNTPEIQENDPDNLLGSLSHLTIKKIKVENANESKALVAGTKKVKSKLTLPTKDKKNGEISANRLKKLKQVTDPANSSSGINKEAIRLKAVKLFNRAERREKEEKKRLDMLQKQETISKLCDFCGDVFPTNEQLYRHKTTKHKFKNFKCPHCPKEYKSRSSLKHHIGSFHEIVRNAVCDTCGKRFFSKKELTPHIETVHQKKCKKKKALTYKCQYCDKTYGYKRGAIVHERAVHTGERPDVCTVCNSAFYDKVYLAEHMRLHNGENPFKCPICGRGYAQRGNMKSHMRNHKISELDSETLSKIKPSYFKFMRP